MARLGQASNFWHFLCLPRALKAVYALNYGFKRVIKLIFKAKGQDIVVNIPSKQALLVAVGERFARHEGFALATINLDHLVKLHTSESFAKAYAAQDLVVADGNPVVWLSRLARRPVSLVPGSEMVLPLAGLAAQQGVKVALFGSTDESLTASAAALQKQVQGVDIVAKISPPMGFDPASDEAAAMLEELESSGAGLVLLALGAPKQEAFAARGRSLAPGLGFACFGAGLDFLSGAQNRAPKWVQAIAMEWAWRAALAPTRLIPRYARCFAILPRLIREALKLR